MKGFPRSCREAGRLRPRGLDASEEDCAWRAHEDDRGNKESAALWRVRHHGAELSARPDKISANSTRTKRKSRHENRLRRHSVFDHAFVRGHRRRRGMLQGMLPGANVSHDPQCGPRLSQACAV
jgi:hypothetical protein